MSKSNLNIFIKWLKDYDKNSNVIFKLDSDTKNKIISDYYKLLMIKEGVEK